ncbi:MAG: tyrosine-type recombinase/integrase, partial [Rhodobacterales bacterium]
IMGNSPRVLPSGKAGAVQAGTFLVFLHDRGISPAEVSSQTLGEYYAYRLTISTKSEKRCQDHVKEIALFLRIVSKDTILSGFGFRAVPHPFEKFNGKYGVESTMIAHLLAEYDLKVAPWTLGQMSRDGVTREAFIAALDESEQQPTDRKALLLAKRAALAARPGEANHESSVSHDELLAASGFLTAKDRWSARTVATRRGYIASLAKSIVASLDIVPATLDELLDPEFLDAAVQAILTANSKEFPSGYIGSILTCVRKIAVDFQCRPEREVKRIENLAERYTNKKRGIAPRNRAKLRKFDAQRIQTTIDLGDTIITGVNKEIDRRRKAHQRKHGVFPKRSDVIDRELARDIMAVIAHETLLRCAPRSDNLINARLDWIGWQNDLAVLTIPARDVKMRDADDEDLRLPLGGRVSKLLRMYLDYVRAKALLENDDVNPYLFPRQSGSGINQPYNTILKRVVTLLHRAVGIKINPHLYRHLIGWIWLKDSLNHLPKVQRLLGHKSLQTTIDYYAEVDADLVFDEWNEYLNNKRASQKRKAA